MQIIVNNTDRFYAVEVDDVLPPVTHVGRRRMNAAQPPLEAHTHGGALEIVYVSRGQIHYELGSRHFEVKGGEMFLSLPGEQHGTGNRPEERSDIYWIGVDIESPAAAWLASSFAGEAAVLMQVIRAVSARQLPAMPVVRESIERVITLLLSTLPYRRLAAAGAVMNLLAALPEADRLVKSRERGGLVQRARGLIEDSLEERVALQTLADRLHISLPYFKSIFRNEAGMPPYAYIQRRKIERAKQLLEERALSITEIAFRLGFPSSQHFAVRFKQMTSQTPSDFRRRKGAC